MPLKNLLSFPPTSCLGCQALWYQGHLHAVLDCYNGVAPSIMNIWLMPIQIKMRYADISQAWIVLSITNIYIKGCARKICEDVRWRPQGSSVGMFVWLECIEISLLCPKDLCVQPFYIWVFNNVLRGVWSNHTVGLWLTFSAMLALKYFHWKNTSVLQKYFVWLTASKPSVLKGFSLSCHDCTPPWTMCH